MHSTTVEPVALDRYTAPTPFDVLIPSARLISAHESASRVIYAAPSEPPSVPLNDTAPALDMKRTDSVDAVDGTFSCVSTLDPPRVTRTHSAKAEPESVEASGGLLMR